MNYEDLDSFEYYERREQKNLELCQAAWFAFKVILVIVILIKLFT